MLLQHPNSAIGDAGLLSEFARSRILILEDFAMVHPGGSLGKRLAKNTRDFANLQSKTLGRQINENN